ncbi:MAG: tyrosine-type recombinase/integrase, partial [SAR324 cluster bacterium]|nr:tyrosine-type recombinase/integrase [SAR324 cluster bacterium]
AKEVKDTARLFPEDVYSNPNAMTRAFRRHLNALGLTNRKIKACHSFRAGYASFLYANGTDIETIRALMGHSNIETTRIGRGCGPTISKYWSAIT